LAKEDMICPFTGKLCGECPLYRGRHYYLCFNKKYRGHIEKSEEATEGNNPGNPETEWAKQIQIPSKMPSAIDPFKRPLADIKD